MTGAPRIIAFGVPAPFPFEAPSSWLSRLAFAQGLASLNELLRFLDLPGDVDLDWHLRGSALEGLRRRCSLSPDSFAIASRVMFGAVASGLGAERLLLAGQRGAARFRYCPDCLKERRVAHLDVHWRFKAWRHCPLHNCMLMDACLACATSLEHPCHMESLRASRTGHASLGRCLHCGILLSNDQTRQIAVGSLHSLGKLEKLWLSNGRSLLAALFHGRYRIREREHPLQELRQLYACGALPASRAPDTIDRKLAAWRAIQPFMTDLARDDDEALKQEVGVEGGQAACASE